MKLRDTLARLNRLQQQRLFKIVATCILAGLALAGAIAYVVTLDDPIAALRADEATTAATAPADPAGADAVRAAEEAATQRIIEQALAASNDPTAIVVGIGVGVVLAITVVWLGLGLTYLGLILAGLVLVVPLAFIPGTGDAPILVGGVLALTAAFTALMQLLRLLLAGPGPVFAVARNVLAEAVRLKLSLVFIILLVFGLAALPGLLDADQPLRYRVQAFLQYATGGSFWIIAVLVLTFAAATVAFEQRDRVIWQTMTKPVAAWQYLLGKWLGVVGLAAVLLAVCGSAIFLFTEYLRQQPAYNERTAYVSTAGGGGPTEDRFILETQVLTARSAVQADPPEFDEEVFEQNVQARVETELNYLSTLDDEARGLREMRREEIVNRIRGDLRRTAVESYRAIAPGQAQYYSFSGLEDAAKSGRELILRIKINAGSNPPDQIYKLTFAFTDSSPAVQSFGLGQTHTIPLLPTAVDGDGIVRLMVVNGDLLNRTVNPETIVFPPDGLEITYAVGGFRMNFVRVMGVLWVKLAFLAMLAVFATTFMSYPVACLVAFTTFLAAEGANFILESLESYRTETREGDVLVVNTVVSWIARAVASVFRVYADLRPTGRLVDGVLLSWADVAVGTVVLIIMSIVLYAAGTYIFSKRELATYSGH